jgi:tetratricopeptide (TPR) repeat protein
MAGCASQSGTGGASSASRAAGTPPAAAADRAAATAKPPVAEVAAEPEPAEAGAATAADSPLTQILAERRRSDFPQLELGEFEFTITEQARIGSDARSDYDRALGLLRQGRLDEGIALLKTVIASTPELTAPYVDLGIASVEAGDFAGAEEALNSARLLSPENPIVHNELGIVYRRTGRFAEARASYEQALSIFAGFHYARRNLAVLCDLYLADSACALENYRAYLAAVGSDDQVEKWVADLENRMNQGG